MCYENTRAMALSTSSSSAGRASKPSLAHLVTATAQEPTTTSTIIRKRRLSRLSLDASWDHDVPSMSSIARDPSLEGNSLGLFIPSGQFVDEPLSLCRVSSKRPAMTQAPPRASSQTKIKGRRITFDYSNQPTKPPIIYSDASDDDASPDPIPSILRQRDSPVGCSPTRRRMSSSHRRRSGGSDSISWSSQETNMRLPPTPRLRVIPLP